MAKRSYEINEHMHAGNFRMSSEIDKNLGIREFKTNTLKLPASHRNYNLAAEPNPKTKTAKESTFIK